MKKPLNTTKTFQHIHQLPLEVSFEQVEQWVLKQPVLEVKPKLWNFDFWSKLFSNN